MPAVKRALDLVALALLVLFAVPVALAIAVAVFLDSPGPIIYRAARVGRGGRAFEMFKFRTMRVGVAGHALAGAGDLRITPVGRFLRTTRLDELPQLLNVLRGEMSLVGPRPELREFVDLHSDEYREILAVQPGITGPTQLRYAGLEARLLSDQEDPDSYYRERLLPDKVALDLAYARSGSLAEDFRVIGRTSVLPITLATQRPREAGPAGLSAPPLAYTAAALAAALLLLLFVLGLGPAR